MVLFFIYDPPRLKQVRETWFQISVKFIPSGQISNNLKQRPYND